MLDDEISFESSGGGEPAVRRLEVLSGPGGRRRWTAEAKGRIIEKTLRPGANISEIARRHGLIPQQLYGWRSAARAREAASGVVFVPMEVDADAAAVGAFASRELASVEHVWVSVDQEGPFTKFLIRYRDEDDRPFKSGPSDLRRYRDVYAQELCARGVAAQASTRSSRGFGFGESRNAYKARQRLAED